LIDPPHAQHTFPSTDVRPNPAKEAEPAAKEEVVPRDEERLPIEELIQGTHTQITPKGSKQAEAGQASETRQ
jgi:hypothetical protein